jgi:hypothetical protein
MRQRLQQWHLTPWCDATRDHMRVQRFWPHASCAGVGAPRHDFWGVGSLFQQDRISWRQPPSPSTGTSDFTPYPAGLLLLYSSRLRGHSACRRQQWSLLLPARHGFLSV